MCLPTRSRVYWVAPFLFLHHPQINRNTKPWKSEALFNACCLWKVKTCLTYVSYTIIFPLVSFYLYLALCLFGGPFFWSAWLFVSFPSVYYFPAPAAGNEDERHLTSKWKKSSDWFLWSPFNIVINDSMSWVNDIFVKNFIYSAMMAHSPYFKFETPHDGGGGDIS